MIVSGDYAGALEAYDKEVRDGFRTTGRALLFHAMGDTERADEELRALLELGITWTYEIAKIYAFRGEVGDRWWLRQDAVERIGLILEQQEAENAEGQRHLESTGRAQKTRRPPAGKGGAPKEREHRDASGCPHPPEAGHVTIEETIGEMDHALPESELGSQGHDDGGQGDKDEEEPEGSPQRISSRRLPAEVEAECREPEGGKAGKERFFRADLSLQPSEMRRFVEGARL